MTRPSLIGLVVLGLVLPAACDTAGPAPTTSTQLALTENGDRVDAAICSPDTGDFSLEFTNPYYPMTVAAIWSLKGTEHGVPLEAMVFVMPVTESVAGVITRVVLEVSWVGYDLVEVTRHFVVEAADGTVCTFGEDVDQYEDFVVVGHEGSWRADEPGHHPAILMPGHPRPGQVFEMQGAPGVAEAVGKILGSKPVAVPAGTFQETLRVRQTDPLTGERREKIYAPGVGLLVSDGLELVVK